MMTFLKNLRNDESGASAAEYALILAIVGSAIVAGSMFLGFTIAEEMNDAATVISTTVTP